MAAASRRGAPGSTRRKGEGSISSSSARATHVRTCGPSSAPGGWSLWHATTVTRDDVRVPTAQAYDRVVDEYVRRNTEVPADFARFRAEFAKAVPAGGRIADLGCGPGRDAARFRAAGLRAVGIDASGRMARCALDDGVPVARADIRLVPLRHGTLDGIWSAASLLHVPRDEVPDTLRSWWRCLRPGGVLAVSTSMGDHEGWETWPYDPASQASTAGLRRWFVHHRPDALVALLGDAGFAVHLTRERESHRRWVQILASRPGTAPEAHSLARAPR